MPEPLTLIIDAAADGAWNMAVDEALLELAAAEGRSFLRFYAWSQPTLSLGYFQPYAERGRHPASAGCAVVRRASGGGAILHDRELTYSLALPQADQRTGAADELYLAAHEALRETLAELGVTVELRRAAGKVSGGAAEPFLCFQRQAAGDVLLEGYKIAGSAQRRRRGGLLQHGSLLLAASPAAPELLGILELAGVNIEPAAVRQAWSVRLAGGRSLVPAADPLWTRPAQRYHAQFASQEWSRRR